MELNDGQKKLLYDAVEWWKSGAQQTFEISGPPGSGKTFIVNLIINALRIPRESIAPMAYTGSAAINMRTKGMMNAGTIFSWLYDFKDVVVTNPDGTPVIDPVFNKVKHTMKFIPKKALLGIRLIIVDECRMVPEEMKAVIDSMGIPVIAMGDVDQLPPIFGKSNYLSDQSNIHYLTEIMRQAENNSIIQLSQMLIKGNDIRTGNYGNVLVIYDDELTDQMISESQIIICGRNSTRDEFIRHMRNDMLKIDSDFPQMGERLVCRKNNWRIEAGGINLTNGLLGSCISAPDASVYDSTDKTFKMNFKADLNDSIFMDIDVDYRYLNGNRQIKDAINDTRFSKGNKFEYGYAITCHMAQGAEFNNGIYIEEYLNKDINNKLHYVGITRFRNFCIYVKRRPKRYW